MSVDPCVDRALLAALHRAWRLENLVSFRQALRPPVLALAHDRARLGSWQSVGRTLTLSRAFATSSPWIVVIEVLRHEMAHQYVDEVLRVHDEAAHGPAFRRVCAERGIDPSAAGLPLGPEPAAARVVEKVRRLLALAGSPEEHEARAAMEAACRLMRRHHLTRLDEPLPLTWAFRQIGRISGRFQVHEKAAAALLAAHFQVAGIWVPAFDVRTGRWGRVLEVSGTPEALEVAEWVHGWLMETAERLWRRWRRAHPHAPGRERRAFLAGVVSGFHDRLDRIGSDAPGCALVALGPAGLDAFVASRHPSARRRAGPSLRLTAAWNDGRETGRLLVMHRPIASGPTRRGRSLEGS
ncbi:MAG: DUF2786 domain-containing protein [Deltaproteobacteria bacterium]|nr:DUF2786 domain-containing protein [Deltaproteobacteria bacterium]